jgi:hypothetical protein
VGISSCFCDFFVGLNGSAPGWPIDRPSGDQVYVRLALGNLFGSSLKRRFCGFSLPLKVKPVAAVSSARTVLVYGRAETES